MSLILEPGRSLVGRAGVTLYRVGSVKESGGVAYAAIDGGMSDNPRPQLYGARYEALLANRADELPSGVYRIAGKHCESGDVLIEAAELPEPRPGDLLAVPATGAYTLALGSTYNGVPRPAVVLVADGEARLIRAGRPWTIFYASNGHEACAGTRRRPHRGRRGDVGHGSDHPQDDGPDDVRDDDRLRRARDPRALHAAVPPARAALGRARRTELSSRPRSSSAPERRPSPRSSSRTR